MLNMEFNNQGWRQKFIDLATTDVDQFEKDLGITTKT